MMIFKLFNGHKIKKKNFFVENLKEKIKLRISDAYAVSISNIFFKQIDSILLKIVLSRYMSSLILNNT